MNVSECQRWLRYAQEDLTTAENLLANNEGFPRHICWLAQQAAEKALKAGLIFCEIEFPFTHDLDRLRNLLPKDWEVRAQHLDLSELTEWAGSGPISERYTGSHRKGCPKCSSTSAQSQRCYFKKYYS